MIGESLFSFSSLISFIIFSPSVLASIFDSSSWYDLKLPGSYVGECGAYEGDVGKYVGEYGGDLGEYESGGERGL